MIWIQLFVLSFWLTSPILGQLPPPCFSNIYCHAENTTSLLHVVQMAKLYNDSKTFVDKGLRSSPKEVLQNFDQLMQVNYDFEVPNERACPFVKFRNFLSPVTPLLLAGTACLLTFYISPSHWQIRIPAVPGPY